MPYRVLTATCVLVMAGCNRIPAPARQAALKEAEALAAKGASAERQIAGRAVGGVENAAARAQPGVTAAKKWAERFNLAMDIYDKAKTAYDILEEIWSSPAVPPLPPFPNASAVRPVSNTPIPVNAHGGYVLPNNVGGFTFYGPDGLPAAFCAYNARVGELQFFTATGKRIG